jgi:hypothetical protein
MGRLTAGCTLASAALLAGCGLLDAPPPGPAPSPGPSVNVVSNGGFEDGDAPWAYKQSPNWNAFAISDTVAHSGNHSLELNLRGDDAASGGNIVGAYAALNATEFPEYLSGYYRVDSWNPHAGFQYLQFVVIVRGGDFGSEFDVIEIRFALAGINREPFNISNARFIFLSRDQPKLHQWVYFGYPLRQAFATRIGKVPTQWDSIEVFLEVRYDGKTAGSGESSADAYFDDIYAGPQALNPNHP